MEEFRAMRRFKQQASDEACLRLLETAPRGVLAVHGDNGYPYAIPLNFVFRGGRIWFHCAKDGHKLDAIRRDDKVCFTLLSEPVKNEGEWWNNVMSVVVFGRIREVTDQAEIDVILRALGEKYFPEGYDIEHDMQKNGPRALVLELCIDHITGKYVKEK